MKKLLVVLLALSCISLMVFADDAKPTVTFSGEVETGFVVNADKATIARYDDDSGNASRIRLGVSATLGDFEAGYYINSLADDATLTQPNAFTACNYWIGYHFFDGKVILRAGQTDAEVTSTVNQGWGDGINANGGVQLIVTPIAGLTIGGAMGNFTSTADDLNGTVFQPAFGFSYAIENVGALCANYTAINKMFTAGFNYTGTPNLVAQLEAYYQQNASVTYSGSSYVVKTVFEGFQNVAYTIGALTPGVTVYEVYNKYDTFADDKGTAFKVVPNVSFKVSDMISLGGEVGYTSNKDGKVVTSDDISWAESDDTATDGTLADSILYVQPFIQFNFNSLASFLKIWYNTGDLGNPGVQDGKLYVGFRAFF